MREMKLKSCPFCSNEAELEKSYDGLDERWRVICPKCFCKTTTFANKKSAIITWNTRKPIERIIERINQLGWIFGKYYSNKMSVEFVSKKSVPLDESIKIIKEEGGLSE